MGEGKGRRTGRVTGRTRLRLVILTALVPALGACAGSVPRPTATTTTAPGTQGPIQNRPITSPPTRPAPTQPAGTSGGFIPPRIMNVPGLEGVIGQDVGGLQRQFGQPALDVVEGDVRKLQFRGSACVLDVYLYPLQPGAAPTATYVDSRRASDGLDVDRAACVAAMRR